LIGPDQRKVHEPLDPEAERQSTVDGSPGKSYSDVILRLATAQ
jgi:hypothetical protein